MTMEDSLEISWFCLFLASVIITKADIYANVTHIPHLVILICVYTLIYITQKWNKQYKLLVDNVCEKNDIYDRDY